MTGAGSISTTVDAATSAEAVTFIDIDGSLKAAPFKPGLSLMLAAVQGGVSGIVAECGGACSCSTCHVILSAADYDRFPPPAETEDQLLDFVAAGRTPTSRLSCQLKLTDQHGDLIVQLPDTQV